MSDVIQAIGPHTDKRGERCEVKCIDNGFAFGFDSDGEPAWWKCASGSWQDAPRDHYLRIVGPWTAFSVGDTVLVNNPYSSWHQCYGTVVAVRDRDVDVEFSNGDRLRFDAVEAHITKVTLPLPVPEGWRLSPLTHRYNQSTKYANNHRGVWSYYFGTLHVGKTVADMADQYPNEAPFFFIEPIPAPLPPEPPQPAVDVGEGWRPLEDEESLRSGDQFLGPKSNTWLDVSSVIGVTVSDAREMLDCTNFRRRVEPQPEWMPTDHYQQFSSVNGVEWTSRWQGKPPITRRIEQKWVRGTEEEWRPVVMDGL